MIKLLKYSIVSGLMFLFTACEVTMPSVEEITTGDNECSLTALALAGDSLKIRVAYTETLSEDHYESVEDRNIRLRMLMFPFYTHYYGLDTTIMEKYRDNLVGKTANVTAETGKGEKIKLFFNPTTLNYECGYKPSPGEQISISASMPSRDGMSTLKASSSVTVPDWRPQVDIAGVKYLYKARMESEDFPGMYESANFADSVAEITLHIQDKSTKINCYRINASGVTYCRDHVMHYDSNYWDEGWDIEIPSQVRWNCAFFTNDPLLYDSQITEHFGPWQAYTTDVFTNRQFKNDAYVTIQVRYPRYMELRKDNWYRFIQIEIQPITSQLMDYLSSLYRMRVAKQSYFSEFSTLPDNIDGGVGIFGGIGKSKKLRIWLDGVDPDYPE